MKSVKKMLPFERKTTPRFKDGAENAMSKDRLEHQETVIKDSLQTLNAGEGFAPLEQHPAYEAACKRNPNFHRSECGRLFLEILRNAEAWGVYVHRYNTNKNVFDAIVVYGVHDSEEKPARWKDCRFGAVEGCDPERTTEKSATFRALMKLKDLVRDAAA